MTAPPITFREFDPNRPHESGIIMEPWLNSWRTSPPLRRSSHHEVWSAAWEERIRSVLDQADTRLIMAVAPDNPDRIYGWICYDPPEAHELDPALGPVVHFAYVKKPFRRFGIATALIKEAGALWWPRIPLIATHWTRLCEDFPPSALHYCPSLFKIRKNAPRKRRNR